MRIVLVGPVYPFKGGIAHYTCLLYKELIKTHVVRLVSFKMQYPRLLFKREQKDYSNDTFKIENAEFLINTVNVFNIIKTGMDIRKSDPDLVIIQWWHPYFAPCYWILEQAIGKNVKVIFICHNVFPHERFLADKFLAKLALRHADGYIVHSNKDGHDLGEIKKDSNYRFNPHPTYNAFKIRNITQEQGRQEIVEKDGFEIYPDTQLLLFFGFVREYKGLKYLLKAMPLIAEQLPKCRLLIVGSFGDDKQDYLNLIKELGIGNYVFFKDDYTPDNEVEKYFVATDLVVLPYIDATQSGIVQIAFGFDKPVVVTNVGGLPDVVDDGYTGFVIKEKSEEDIAFAVKDFYINGKSTKMRNNILLESEKFSWAKMCDTIIELI